MDLLTSELWDAALESTGPVAPPRVAPGRVPVTARLAPRIMLMREGSGQVRPEAEQLVAAAGAGGGQPLPAEARTRFEASLGTDLSSVRVHTGDDAAQASAAVGARAYALGNDIHFGAGQYRPDDPFGLHLLAHEVAHTVQHQGGGARPAFKLEVSSPHDAAEHEADRAADAMVAGRTFTIAGAGTALQLRRASLTPDQKQKWDDAKGDDVVRKLQRLAAEWDAYAASPRRFSDMPGKKSCDSIQAEVETLLATEASFRGYLQAQLGGALRALNQMVSINQLDCGSLVGVIPGVTFAPPNHQYKLTARSAGKVVTQLHIEYSNKFGWGWSHEMSGRFFGVELVGSASVEPGKDGKKAKVKPGAGVKPAVFALEIAVAASAKPAGYWGLDDLPGIVAVATMEAELPIAGTVGLGGSITVNGNGHPGSLDFLAPTVAPTGGKLSKSITVKIREGGGSMSVQPGDNEHIDVPPTDPGKPVRDSQEWKATVRGFATGGAEVPMPEYAVMAQVVPINEQLKQLAAQQAAIASELEEAGVPAQEREFHVEVNAVGYASRRWRDARNEAERLARNQKLSEQRAHEVIDLVRPLIGPEHAYAASGAGAAATDRGSGNAPPVPDADVERQIADARELLRKDHPDWDDARLDREARARFSGKHEDDSESRTVLLTIRWSGWKLDYTGAPPAAPGGKP
jgi:hypothetical protein